MIRLLVRQPYRRSAPAGKGRPKPARLAVNRCSTPLGTWEIYTLTCRGRAADRLAKRLKRALPDLFAADTPADDGYRLAKARQILWRRCARTHESVWFPRPPAPECALAFCRVCRNVYYGETETDYTALFARCGTLPVYTPWPPSEALTLSTAYYAPPTALPPPYDAFCTGGFTPETIEAILWRQTGRLFNEPSPVPDRTRDKGPL